MCAVDVSTDLISSVTDAVMSVILNRTGGGSLVEVRLKPICYHETRRGSPSRTEGACENLQLTRSGSACCRQCGFELSEVE